MIRILKKLFTNKNKNEFMPDPPGRTFKKIITGEYFGHEGSNTDKKISTQEKQKKIDQIHNLELKPMYVKYSYSNTTNGEEEISSAYVSFQKEVPANNWNMIHVTEISFTVDYSDFKEFESMLGISLTHGFRDLTVISHDNTYEGNERRKNKR